MLTRSFIKSYLLVTSNDLLDVFNAGIQYINENNCVRTHIPCLLYTSQKLVAFMTGNGEVNLSDSLREAVVAGVRAEFEARELKPVSYTHLT